MALGAVEVAPGQAHVAQRVVDPRIVGIERQRLLGQPQRLPPVGVLAARHPDPGIGRADEVVERQPRVGAGEGRIELAGPLEQLPGLRPAPPGVSMSDRR